MYTIKRNNRRFNNMKFPTYEEARKYVRAFLVKTKLTVNQELARLSNHGFSISKVA